MKMDGNLIKNILLGICLILFVLGVSVVLIVIGVRLNIEDLTVLGCMFLALITIILFILIIGRTIRDSKDISDGESDDNLNIKDNEVLFNYPEMEDYDNKAYETKEQVVTRSADTRHQYVHKVAIETKHSDDQSSERYKTSRSNETQYAGLSSASHRYRTEKNYDVASRASSATYRTLDDTTIHIPDF